MGSYRCIVRYDDPPPPAATVSPSGRRPPAGSDVVVVVPAFRAASVISAALASIAAQSVLPAQVVVVDDGSDDGTADVARRFSELLPLDVVSQRNAGPAAARRSAVAASTAPLIALLDADDVWLPDHLGLLVSAHGRRGGIVTADALPWRPGGMLSLASRRSQFKIPPPRLQRVEILRDNFVFIGALFSRALYEVVGGFRDGFTGAEDWDLWIRMIRTGAVVHGTLGSPTVLYRVVDGSLTRRASIYDRYLAVLQAAGPGCTTDEERQVLESRLAWVRARRGLAHAYEAAGEGRRAAARQFARESLGGSAKVTAQGLGILVAPGTTAKLADRVRHGAPR